MELKEIILGLKLTAKETGLEISDETIFDCAVRIYNSGNIKGIAPTEEKATEKQVKLLYKLNADFNEETITKREAMDLITQLMEKFPKKKENYFRK